MENSKNIEKEPELLLSFNGFTSEFNNSVLGSGDKEVKTNNPWFNNKF
jgi:hypothetical protein